MSDRKSIGYSRFIAMLNVMSQAECAGHMYMYSVLESSNIMLVV